MRSDLGPICLHMLSADDTTYIVDKKLKIGVFFWKGELDRTLYRKYTFYKLVKKPAIINDRFFNFKSF